MLALPRGSAVVSRRYACCDDGFAHIESAFLREQRLPRYRAQNRYAKRSEILGAAAVSAQTTSTAPSSAQPRSAKMYRMLRISGVLLIIGLLIEAISLHYNHPLSFLGFMFIGGALL